MKKNQKKRKRSPVVYILVILAVALILLGTAVLAAYLVMKADSEEDIFHTEDFLFRIPDWDADIFKDEEYLALDRSILYQNGAESYALSDAQVSSESAVAFFPEYVDAIVSADSEQLNSLYTEEYLKENGRFEPFTMQRLYSIVVSYRGTCTLDGPYDEAEVYDLSYKILKNDGTFRRDIESNASRTQIIYLVKTEQGYRIYDVDYYRTAK